MAITLQCNDADNWTKITRSNFKGPYGTYILHKEVKELLDADSLVSVDQPLYQFFHEYYDYDAEKFNINGTYIYIHYYSNNLGINTTRELLDWVSHGNTVFMSTKNFPQALRDSLGFETSGGFTYLDSLPSTLQLNNKNFNKSTFKVSKGIEKSHFTNIDPENTTILGTHTIDGTTYVNFIKIKHVYGTFYLHTQPIALTNYYLLNYKTKAYTENVFSYLKNNTIIWDHDRYYNEEGESGNNDRSLFTPLSFLFKQQALAWAFFVALGAVVFFILFNAKRKQRIIPIIKPLQNTTISFAKTIGNLYYQEQDHKSIANKKILYFLEKIRNTYLLETDTLDANFIERLHLKSGKKKGEIKLLINYIVKLNNAYECSEQDLVRLNNLIEKFYKK